MVKKEENLVKIIADKATIEGNLIMPTDAKGVVLFAHGSGSSRFSHSTRYIILMIRAP
jgi:putative phosphoribosyl transferase